MDARHRILVGTLASSVALVGCTGADPEEVTNPGDPTAAPAGVEPTATPSASPAPRKEFLRHRTDLEIFVIRVVREAGASDVGVAEPAHGDPDADIWGQWMGEDIFIQGYLADEGTTNHEVLETLRIDGRRVLEVREFNRRELYLRCGLFTYEVGKSLDGRWDHELMASFVRALIHSANC